MTCSIAKQGCGVIDAVVSHEPVLPFSHRALASLSCQSRTDSMQSHSATMSLLYAEENKETDSEEQPYRLVLGSTIQVAGRNRSLSVALCDRDQKPRL